MISIFIVQYWLFSSTCIIKSHSLYAGPQVIKLLSCSTKLSMKIQLLIKIKMLKIKRYSCFTLASLSDVEFILLISVKMPTIVGILTFMSRISFMLS